MNPLVYVSVGLYFEILNSHMYGGEGSVGYVAASFGGVDIRKITDDLIKEQRLYLSNAFKIPVDSVKLISKEEYDCKTVDNDKFDTYTQSW